MAVTDPTEPDEALTKEEPRPYPVSHGSTRAGASSPNAPLCFPGKTARTANRENSVHGRAKDTRPARPWRISSRAIASWMILAKCKAVPLGESCL